MTTAVATIDTSMLPWQGSELSLIKQQIAKDCTDLELALFAKVCQRTRLDPFVRQIYAIKRGGKMTIQTGIDGYRLLADRTKCYAGSDDAEFDIDDGEYPTWAKVTVWKIVQGQRFPFTAKARWNEYHVPNNDMWKRMPYLMLAKCAEALALRKAFPEELSGIYTQDEMDQADMVEEAPATPKYRTPAAPMRSLGEQVQDRCKELGIRAEALKQYMLAHQYNSKTVLHQQKVLDALSDDHELAELHLRSLAVSHLMTIDTLVQIIRRRSGDEQKSWIDCWASYCGNRDDWEAVISEEQTMKQQPEKVA